MIFEMTSFTPRVRICVGAALCLSLTTLSTVGFAQTPVPASVTVTTVNGRDTCHFQGYTLTADSVVCSGITITATGKAKLTAPTGITIGQNRIFIPDCVSTPLKNVLVSGGASDDHGIKEPSL
jgi:hypothetical protein